jgi:hypothetical protein
MDSPEWAGNFLALGKINEQYERYEDAIVELDRSILLKPKMDKAYLVLARVYGKLHRANMIYWYLITTRLRSSVCSADNFRSSRIASPICLAEPFLARETARSSRA